MSADTTTLILCNPDCTSHEMEYSVAQVGAVENITDYNDDETKKLIRNVFFGARVHNTLDSAMKEAQDWEKDHRTEYGIRVYVIDYDPWDHPDFGCII